MKNAIRLIVFGVTIASAASIGLAQHKLDRNLERGSGGINSQSQGTNYAARNNVVTGNVVGGREFRDDGSLGYVSPGAFSDQLGTDDLFRFRARSMSLGSLGRSGPSYVNLAPQPVFSGSPAISAGDVYRQRSQLLPTVQARDAATFKYGRSVAALSGTAFAGAGTSVDGYLGMIKRNGKRMRLMASELRGLRAVPIASDLLTIGGTDLDPIAIATAATPPFAEDAEPARDKADASGTSDAQDHGGPPMRIDKTSMWTPSLEIGEQIMALVEPQPVDAKFKQKQERIELIERSILDSQKTKGAEPGDDVYADMLKKIEAQIRGEPITELADPADGPADQPLPDGADDGVDAEAGSDEPTDVEIELPDASKLLAARDARIREIARLHPQAPVTIDGGSGADVYDIDNLQIPGHLGRLVKMLDHDLPPLGSMAGKSDSRVNQLFRDAETQMSRGKYFKAERSYRSILSYKADHPLATAGVIHAQLGAGMIRTAAYTLRQYFTRHPELVATRYRANLLPSAARMQRATRQARSMIEQNNPVAPLVLAYLGYHMRSSELVRYGLDVAQSRRPRDRLLPLLRRIWLDGNKRDIHADANNPIPQMASEKTDAASPIPSDAPVKDEAAAPQITK